MLDKLIQSTQPILDQIGDVNLSKSHLKNWKVQEPYLPDLMNHCITPTVFVDRKRWAGGKELTNVERMLNFMVLDHDGNCTELVNLLISLREKNISYITWASPSRKTKIETHFKTRIIIPTVGLTKGMYPKQFLQLLIELGQNIGIETDESARDVARFFYPPNMSGVKEPHSFIVNSKGTAEKDGQKGFWKVLNPKPRNQSQVYALESIESYLGEPYVAKRRFTKAMTETIEDRQAYAYSERETVYIDDNFILQHDGSDMGLTFAEVIASGTHTRCDCPFDGDHGTSSKIDSAFVSNGHVLCSSNSHAHLIGRPKCEEVVFPPLEEVEVNEGWL